MRPKSFFAVSVVVCLSLQAGEFNRVLNIGDTAPDWAGLAGIDGKMHESQEFANAKFLIVAFTCNSCPYAVDAESRLNELTEKTRRLGGDVVAINVNTIEEDNLEAMKLKAETKKFGFCYLYDSTQAIAKAFGATTTPEFYLLGHDRKVVYMGALDDSPDGKAIMKPYLVDAIDAYLKSQVPTVKETVPIGCRIRFARLKAGPRSAN